MYVLKELSDVEAAAPKKIDNIEVYKIKNKSEIPDMNPCIGKFANLAPSCINLYLSLFQTLVFRGSARNPYPTHSQPLPHFTPVINMDFSFR